MLLPRLADSQQSASEMGTITVGAGNVYGGIGLNLDLYLFTEHLSAFGGVGIVPDTRAFWAHAVGLRYHAGGHHHRVFGEVAYCLLDWAYYADIGIDDPVTDYGPAVSVGYRFMTNAGLTFTIGVGAGPTNHEGIFPVAHLGAGWTWGRPRR